MKKIPFLFALLFFGMVIYAQNEQAVGMNNYKMDEIIRRVADTVAGIPGRWQFVVKDRIMIAITDANANRMRIISPIAELSQIDEDLKTKALTANFHTVLDAKYAISDDYIWSIFVHPLRELTEAQLEDAIKQVYYAGATCVTIYTSTDLYFPGSAGQKAEEMQKKKLEEEKELPLKKKSKF